MIITILDWDDTLFPTSWFVTNNIKYENHYNFFKQLDQFIYKTISNISANSTVILITNAMPNWISTCFDNLPLTKTVIRQVISARHEYQQKYPDSMQWKKHVFYDLYIKYKPKTIVSIGDAEYEYYALTSLTSLSDDSCLLKSVKFLKKPQPKYIFNQLCALNKIIPRLYKIPRHIDLIVKIC